MITRCGLGLLVLSVGLGAVFLGQEAPTPEEAQQSWMEAMTPGAAQKGLAERVGTWDLTVRMWMDPSSPPSTSKGTSVQKMIMGGRYLEDVTHTMIDNMPFEGRGIVGFNNSAKRYEYSWIDSMGTAISFGTGTMAADGKTINWETRMMDPVTKVETTMYSTDTRINKDHYLSEMFITLPDGSKMKTLEFDYRRKS